jgi:hypothetical protein
MKIAFSCRDELVGVIPKPAASNKFFPEYFRKLNSQIGNDVQDLTVKRCVPFLEAMSAGFIIPLWCDVHVVASNGEITLSFPRNWRRDYQVGKHTKLQIGDHPDTKKKYGNLPLKWVNPWVIETEPGVSCLFTSPMNHGGLNVKLVDGVVDTDNYYNTINFPFFWTGGDGEFILSAGTPLIQVIPFRRDAFDLEFREFDYHRMERTRGILSTRLRNSYREDMWHKGKNVRVKDGDHSEPEAVSNAMESTSEVVPHEIQVAEKSRSNILHDHGYVVLRDLITQADAENLAQKLREYIEETGAQPDPLCPRSKAVHGMPASDELLEMLTPAVSAAAGRNLVPTYSYARMYINGESLPKHTDRPACQYSVTLCLGMDGDPWPIFMAEKSDAASGTPYEIRDDSTHYMGEPTAAHLNVGDGVLYLGMDMVHYREPFEGQWQAQVFLHWVDADGPHADQKYDGRLALSHHSVAVNVDDNVIPLSASSAMSSGILEVVADDSGRGFGEGVF